MSEAFKGVINVDIRDSTPDWGHSSRRSTGRRTQPVIHIVLDDVGFSAMSAATAGRSRRRTSTAIAADGVRYTQCHTTALCSPTRSSC